VEFAILRHVACPATTSSCALARAQLFEGLLVVVGGGSQEVALRDIISAQAFLASVANGGKGPKWLNDATISQKVRQWWITASCDGGGVRIGGARGLSRYDEDESVACESWRSDSGKQDVWFAAR
jgi:hypothetical protein